MRRRTFTFSGLARVHLVALFLLSIPIVAGISANAAHAATGETIPSTEVCAGLLTGTRAALKEAKLHCSRAVGSCDDWQFCQVMAACFYGAATTTIDCSRASTPAAKVECCNSHMAHMIRSVPECRVYNYGEDGCNFSSRCPNPTVEPLKRCLKAEDYFNIDVRACEAAGTRYTTARDLYFQSCSANVPESIKQELRWSPPRPTCATPDTRVCTTAANGPFGSSGVSRSSGASGFNGPPSVGPPVPAQPEHVGLGVKFSN